MTFDEKRLYFITDLNETTDWQTADSICQQTNSSLVSIHNEIQNEFLVNRTKHFNQEFWIGLRGDSETHLWSDKSLFDYNQLNYRSIAKISLHEHKCAAFQSDSGLWKYNDCNDTKFGFICQFVTQDLSNHDPNGERINFHK